VTTGDVARDVLERNLALASPPQAREPFALVTIHRAALTDDAETFRAVMNALGDLGLPAIFPVHPRTRTALEHFDLLARVPPSVSLRSPMGYLETIAAVRDAAVVVTDSGGLQREAYWLGTPCVTLRSETEWAETVECGANVLVPPMSAIGLLAATVAEQRQRRSSWPRGAYGDGQAARKVADATGTYLGLV
jgi:UDP-GlcNAc3NAcA epimerase